MRRKILLKTFLKDADPKQQVELVLVICLNVPPDDYETDPVDFKSVYIGDAEKVPQEYEGFEVNDWGIRGENNIAICIQ